jgi:hypothetical protein
VTLNPPLRNLVTASVPLCQNRGEVLSGARHRPANIARSRLKRHEICCADFVSCKMLVTIQRLIGSKSVSLMVPTCVFDRTNARKGSTLKEFGNPPFARLSVNRTSKSPHDSQWRACFPRILSAFLAAPTYTLRELAECSSPFNVENSLSKFRRIKTIYSRTNGAVTRFYRKSEGVRVGTTSLKDLPAGNGV